MNSPKNTSDSVGNKSTNNLWSNLSAAVVSAAGGGFIGAGLQPFYVYKVRDQQAPEGTKWLKIHRAIVAEEGFVGYWKGWELAVAKSAAKQGVKGTALAWANQQDWNVPTKVLVSGGVMTATLGPLDRVMNAFIKSKNVTLTEVVRQVAQGGVKSIYRGGPVDFFKNSMDGAVVIGLNEARKRYRAYTGAEASSPTVWDWLGMTFLGTAVKLGATNWLDVVKTVQQGELNKSLTVRDVWQLKGPKAFFLAGFWARFGLNYAAMLVNYGVVMFTGSDNKK